MTNFSTADTLRIDSDRQEFRATLGAMSFPEPEEFVTGGMSDIGQVREVNQDYCGEFDDPATRRRLLIVADGMGGHLGGEVASRMAVETAAEIFKGGSGDDAETLLDRALSTANERVHKASQEDMDLAGMGTTGVCLLFESGGHGWVAHVGDSRGYRLRNGSLEQITEDHSVVGALIRMGHITEEEARQHPQRNEILRAIGTNDEVEVQVTPLDLEPGDQYLLCSDGLSGLVADSDIAEVMGRLEPQDAVRTLVQMANLEGGNDNITVQIAWIPGEPGEKARTTEVIVAPEIGERAGPPAWVWIAGVVLVGALLGLLFSR
jgi:protein phosphatase